MAKKGNKSKAAKAAKKVAPRGCSAVIKAIDAIMSVRKSGKVASKLTQAKTKVSASKGKRGKYNPTKKQVEAAFARAYSQGGIWSAPISSGKPAKASRRRMPKGVSPFQVSPGGGGNPMS